jgi:glycosyltransferase involved in cell wall biosynthesis
MGLTISVVIPTYNVAPFLQQAVWSVLDQTRRPTEIIIVDDCSTDDTAGVARSFTDPRIKLLSTSTNSGSSVARNVGIDAATGDLIAMLDGDDYWLQDHLAVVAGLLDEHPTPALAFSPTQAFGTESWVWPLRIASDKPVHCFWDCIPRTIIPQMNVVMRRQALLDIGGYSEDLLQSQDFDLFMRLAYAHPFICTQKVTSRYRRHSGSITMRQPQNALHCMYLARYQFGLELAEKVCDEELAEFHAAGLEVWETALRHCVLRHNWRLMDFHLNEAQYVPGSEAVLLRWKLRRAAGVFQRAWELANRPLPDLLSSAA